MKNHILKIVLPIAALVALVPQASQAAVIADLQTDYVQPAFGDVSNGANNWWYRYSPGGAYDATSSNFTMWSNGTAFTSGGVELYDTAPISGLPGDPTGADNWSNIRYVPVATEAVTITGTIQKTSTGGDGITFYISNNNAAPLFTQSIGFSDTTVYNFSFNTTLTSGDRLDFLVSPNAANNWNDNFNITATISQIPEPTSLALLAIGGVAILGLRRRRQG